MATNRAAVICFFCCAFVHAQGPLPSPARKSLLQQSFGKPALIRTGVSAGWDFALKSPHEWPRTTEWFGRRYASSFSRHLVKGTVQYGVGAWRDEDLTYYKSDQTRFGPRLRHALVSTVVARNSQTGRPTVALSRISGNFAGGFISRLWQPDRLRTVGSAFSTTSTSFAVDAATNVLREFWKRRRRPAVAAGVK